MNPFVVFRGEDEALQAKSFDNLKEAQGFCKSLPRSAKAKVYQSEGQLRDEPTKPLIDIYNALTGEQVERFKSRDRLVQRLVMASFGKPTGRGKAAEATEEAPTTFEPAAEAPQINPEPVPIEAPTAPDFVLTEPEPAKAPEPGPVAVAPSQDAQPALPGLEVKAEPVPEVEAQDTPPEAPQAPLPQNKAIEPPPPAQDAPPANKRNPRQRKPYRERVVNIPATGKSQGGPMVPRWVGTKQAVLIDLLARPEGVTFDELMAVMGDRQRFPNLKPWSEMTAINSLSWYACHIAGYGVRTEARPDGTLAYHLVLPEGLDKPLPHRSPKARGRKVDQPRLPLGDQGEQGAAA
jgi:hypothetical protein